VVKTEHCHALHIELNSLLESEALYHYHIPSVDDVFIVEWFLSSSCSYCKTDTHTYLYYA